MRFRTNLFSVVMSNAALAVVAFPRAALAANSDWVKPGIGLVETLQSGLVTIGAIIVGLSVVGFAIFTAVQSVLSSQQPRWGVLGTIIIAGVLIMTGPSMIAALLEAVN